MEHDTPPDSPRSPSPSTGSGQAGLAKFWQELKQRHVVRVATVYAVVAWLIIQIASTTFEGFGIPDWAFRFVVLMVILGFPVSLIIAWAFELTPQGIKTTKVAQEETEITEGSMAHVKKRNWYSVIFAAAVPTFIFGTLAIFFYFRSGTGDSDSLLSVIDKSIAVLPLENMSPDPDNAFFAAGVQEELAEVLSRRKFDPYVTLKNRKQFIRLLGRISERVEIVRRIQVCRDPKDDKFLELTVNGEADLIISGDKDLLVLNPFSGISILSPSDYLNHGE